MVGPDLKESNLYDKGLSSSPERDFCEHGLFAPARVVFVDLASPHPHAHAVIMPGAHKQKKDDKKRCWGGYVTGKKKKK